MSYSICDLILTCQDPREDEQADWTHQAGFEASGVPAWLSCTALKGEGHKWYHEQGYQTQT